MKKNILLATYLVLAIGVSNHCAYARNDDANDKSDHTPESVEKPKDEKKGVSRRVTDFFTGVFGERAFQQELNVERFKVDLAVLKGLDEPEHKVLLYYILYHFLDAVAQHNPEQAASLRPALEELDRELQTELFQKFVKNFKERQGRQPNESEKRALEEQVRDQFRNSSIMPPMKKLPLVEQMEVHYEKVALTDEVRNQRHAFFEWIRERVYQEMQEADLLAQQHGPRKGWAKYKKYVYRVAIAAAAGASVFYGYRWMYGTHPLRGWAKLAAEKPDMAIAKLDVLRFLIEITRDQKIPAHGTDPEVNYNIKEEVMKKELPGVFWKRVREIMNEAGENGVRSQKDHNEVLRKAFKTFFEGDQKIISFQLGSLQGQ